MMSQRRPAGSGKPWFTLTLTPTGSSWRGVNGTGYYTILRTDITLTFTLRFAPLALRVPLASRIPSYGDVIKASGCLIPSSRTDVLLVFRTRR